jgi:hypothetical protein
MSGLGRTIFAPRMPLSSAVTIAAPLSVDAAASVACPSIKARSPHADCRSPKNVGRLQRVLLARLHPDAVVAECCGRNIQLSGKIGNLRVRHDLVAAEAEARLTQ